MKAQEVKPKAPLLLCMDSPGQEKAARMFSGRRFFSGNQRYDAGLVVIDQLIERFLQEGVGADGVGDHGHHKINEGKVSILCETAVPSGEVDGIAHAIEPINLVDAEGDDGKEDGLSGRGSRFFTGSDVGAFGKLVKPVKSVDAAGNDTEYDVERDASFHHDKTNLSLGKQEGSLS